MDSDQCRFCVSLKGSGVHFAVHDLPAFEGLNPDDDIIAACHHES